MARELHTKSSVRNNFDNRGYRRVRFRSCGTVGYGPTMWGKRRKGVDVLHDRIKKDMSKHGLSVMLATMSVPRARDEENHFPAR